MRTQELGRGERLPFGRGGCSRSAASGKLPVVSVLTVVVVLGINNFTMHINSGVFARFAIISMCSLQFYLAYGSRTSFSLVVYIYSRF